MLRCAAAGPLLGHHGLGCHWLLAFVASLEMSVACVYYHHHHHHSRQRTGALSDVSSASTLETAAAGFQLQNWL